MDGGSHNILLECGDDVDVYVEWESSVDSNNTSISVFLCKDALCALCFKCGSVGVEEIQDERKQQGSPHYLC